MPFLARLDDVFDRWGERFNPIVVKETRQAIKSRGFSYAFMTMLFVCLVESLLLVSSYGERLYQIEAGREFFPWYLGSLLVAICFVVPMGLFRSVVSEFDGQTFEMLAITTLSPRQIVFGKLKSATVQMGAFYSAAAPFLCFTYMLQGLSVPGIVLSLVIAYLAGLSSCMGSMMLGSLGKQSGWQIICLLAAVILGCITFGIGFGTAAAAAIEIGGASSFGSICAGFGCFGYAFLFFSLLTLGVSIAQFTPTMPRPGQIEVRRSGAVRSKPATTPKPTTAAAETPTMPPETAPAIESPVTE
jgi:hypothetical protein